MKPEISARYLGKYEGAENIAMDVQLYVLRALDSGKTWEEAVRSLLGELKLATERWNEERQVWVERHNDPGSCACSAQQPYPKLEK